MQRIADRTRGIDRCRRWLRHDRGQHSTRVRLDGSGGSELDLDWLEEHRRLQVRSLEWHRKKDPSLLLRGRDLRNARHMLATATSKDPIPTELQQKYIQYSLQSERSRTVAWIATPACSFTTGAVFDVAGGRLGL